MSRIRFTDDQQFIDWLQNRNKNKYEFYSSPERLVAVPTVSTRPVLYGILNKVDEGNGDVKSAIRSLGYGPIYEVTEYNFDERSSGQSEQKQSVA